jgi:oligopeptide/dipeptide ABC transporter ATP-binding protein
MSTIQATVEGSGAWTQSAMLESGGVTMVEKKELMSLSDVKMYFSIKNNKRLFAKKQFLRAVDNVSFTIYEGETLGIVGESGCGKSTTGKIMAKLLTPTEGRITFESKDINKLNKKEDLAYKKKVQLVFQDPYSSLDPKFTVGRCIEEPLVIHKVGNSKERKVAALSLLEEVGLSANAYKRHPHEFSGGQRQRIGIARALTLKPSLIICDEPVSALDVSIQAKILNMMKDLQKKYNLAYVFISHNLAVVNHMCDRVLVMYLGNIVEEASREELFNAPLHPYSVALLKAIPVIGEEGDFGDDILHGDVPSPINPPEGCCFYGRCKFAIERCRTEKPKMRATNSNHRVACHII